MTTLTVDKTRSEAHAEASDTSQSKIAFGAPIKSSEDSRLYGTFLADLSASCSDWTKKSYDSINLKKDDLHVTALKSLKFGAKVAVTALPRILSPVLSPIGKMIRAGHYYSLSKEAREKPPVIRKGSLSLDQFPVKHFDGEKPSRLYHWTPERNKEAIMRSGFRADYCRGGMMGQATYAAIDPTATQSYGNTRFTLNFNLDEDQILSTDLCGFQTVINTYSPEKREAVRALFLENGYRAVQYKCLLEDDTHSTPALAIYDDSCISIAKVETPKKADQEPQTF